MITKEEIVLIGKFQKTHALKGELNVLLEVDPDYIEDGNPMVVDIDGIFVPFFAESVRPKGNTSFLIKLDGIDSEEDAKSFVNKEVYAEKNKLASYYDLDPESLGDEESLVGFEVIDADTGEKIGVIERLDTSTQNMLFIVETNDDDIIYIPAVEEFIDEINEESKKIRMNLPVGLLGLNDK